MCNGHEHVCLEVNVTLFFVYCSLGMALIMTGAHGWSWWWLQKRTLLGESLWWLLGAVVSTLTKNQRPFFIWKHNMG